MSLVSTLHSPRHNQILNAISDAEYALLSPHLELVPMPCGLVICESGERLTYAYFPTTSIVSLSYALEDGSSANVSVIGNEGAFGLRLLFGTSTTPNRALVISAGFGYRIKAQFLMGEFNHAASLMRIILRFTQALITQMTQTAACNRHHSLEQQLCRWLLMNLDRISANEINMTHELIANMLGVRREGVTEAASKLQFLNIIHYNRGHINILNREKLEDQCCECYRVVKSEYDRLLPVIDLEKTVKHTSQALKPPSFHNVSMH